MICSQPVWFVIGIFDKRAGVSTCTADKTEQATLPVVDGLVQVNEQGGLLPSTL